MNLDFTPCEIQKAVKHYFNENSVKDIRSVIVDSYKKFSTDSNIVYYGVISNNKQTVPILFTEISNSVDFTNFQGYEIELKLNIDPISIELFFLDEPFSYDDFVSIESSSLVLGGVADVITDKAVLATYFDFDEVDITSFKIFGNDVFCEISDTDYEIVGGGLPAGLTSFVEKGGYLKKDSRFAGLLLLTKVHLYGFEYRTAGSLLYNCHAINDVYMPELTRINNNDFRAIYAANMVLTLDKVTTTSDYYCFRTTIMKKVILISLLSAGATLFQELTCDVLDIRNVTQFNVNPALDVGAFTLSVIGTAYIHNSMATNNGGGVDATVAVLAGLGTNIIYV